MSHAKMSVVLVAALAASTVAASAQTARHRPRSPVVQQYANERPPLTVTKRSFLDPGPVVPVGSMSNYVTMNTTFSKTPDQVYNTAAFGNDRLPRPLEVPGRPSPVIEWVSPPFPD